MLRAEELRCGGEHDPPAACPRCSQEWSPGCLHGCVRRKVALRTADYTIDAIAEEITSVVRPAKPWPTGPKPGATDSPGAAPDYCGVVDQRRRDTIAALDRAARFLSRAEQQLSEREAWTTGEAWASSLAQTVRSGRQSLWLLHHDRGWGWEWATAEERVEAERIAAALAELGATAKREGAYLLPHEALPGDVPPNLR